MRKRNRFYRHTNIMSLLCCPPLTYLFAKKKDVELVDGEAKDAAALQGAAPVSSEKPTAGGQKASTSADDGEGLLTDGWSHEVEAKLQTLADNDRAVIRKLGADTDIDTAAANLRREYESKGLLKGYQAVVPILQKVQGFERALSTLAQAGGMPCMLVWGSLQLLLKVSLRYYCLCHSLTR